jgi:hypothetical protein
MSPNCFSKLLLAFALLLGLQSMWIVVPETLRPRMMLLPFDTKAAAAAKLQRSNALLAASLGSVRGDLWAETALTYADLIWTADPIEREDNHKFEQEARDYTERALTYSPHRADIWLLLAALAYRFSWADARIEAALELSYYTGSHEIALLPLRLYLSVSAHPLYSTELQEMVRHDVFTIIIRKPDLKPVLFSAYNNALPENRKFLENAIADVDSNLLTSLRNGLH